MSHPVATIGAGEFIRKALAFPSDEARRAALSRSRRRVRDDVAVASVVEMLATQLSGHRNAA